MVQLSDVEKAVTEMVTSPEFRYLQRQAGSWAALADKFDEYHHAYEMDSHALAHLIRLLDAMGALD